MPGLRVRPVTDPKPPEVVVKTDARSLSPASPPKVSEVTVVFNPLEAVPAMLVRVSNGLLASALMFPKVSVPAEMIVVPAKALLPERTIVPSPVFVKLVAAPARVEEIVWVLVEVSALMLVVAARVMVPPESVTVPVLAITLKLSECALTVPTGTVPPPNAPTGPPQLQMSVRVVVKFPSRVVFPVLLLVQMRLRGEVQVVVETMAPKLPPPEGSQ